MQAAHTPPPWQVAHGTNVVADDRTIALCATVAGGPNAEQEPLINQANAAFIVRAVNTHDELLAACQAALAFITAGGQGAPPIDALRGALAAARAEERQS